MIPFKKTDKREFCLSVFIVCKLQCHSGKDPGWNHNMFLWDRLPAHQCVKQDAGIVRKLFYILLNAGDIHNAS